MVTMLLGWLLYTKRVSTVSLDAEAAAPLLPPREAGRNRNDAFFDLVDPGAVDLRRDEYDEPVGVLDESEDIVQKRLSGRTGVLWTIYYWLI